MRIFWTVKTEHELFIFSEKKQAEMCKDYLESDFGGYWGLVIRQESMPADTQCSTPGDWL